MAVDGETSGSNINAALMAGAGGNMATAYGDGVASPESAAVWLNAPATGAPSMAGTNLCDGVDCRISVDDFYGNTFTFPLVVEIVSLSDGVAVVDSPEFVLVNAGQSPVIPAIRIYAVGDADSAPPDPVVAASFGLQHVGANTSVAVVSVSVSRCEAGWGSVADPLTGTGLSCHQCPVGAYSDALSWAACEPCPGGTSSAAVGSSECALCAPGYGWNAAAAACALCPVDTFSDDTTLQMPCQPCPGGATTNGTAGAIECTTPLVCLPGNGSVVIGGERACAPCPTGTFNANTTVEACEVCPDGTTTDPEAIGATGCDWCDAGFGVDALTGDCLACPEGTYAENATLGGNCTQCDGSTVVVGDLAIDCLAAAALDVDVPALIITGSFALLLIVLILVSLCLFKATGAKHKAIATVIISLYDVTTD